MSGRAFASGLLVACAVASGAGCTFLVNFDDRLGAGCSDGPCDAGATRDATLEGSAADSTPAVDVTTPTDVTSPLDVGNCSVLSEGEPCAHADSCRGPSTCHAGVCALHPLADGTSCGVAPDACHRAPVCASGVCAPPAPVADGTSCGAAPDACHEAPACSAGVCDKPAAAADGTKCGTAPDACHTAPTCSKGACGAAAALPEGAQWRSGDAYARCCGGSPVETKTSANCGVCGWVCESGLACQLVDGAYLCTGCTANSECASGCCSTVPAPNHCSPSNCAGSCQTNACTGGSHCVAGASVDYCSY